MKNWGKCKRKNTKKKKKILVLNNQCYRVTVDSGKLKCSECRSDFFVVL